MGLKPHLMKLELDWNSEKFGGGEEEEERERE
jgi:hypothetical protein